MSSPSSLQSPEPSSVPARESKRALREKSLLSRLKVSTVPPSFLVLLLTQRNGISATAHLVLIRRDVCTCEQTPPRSPRYDLRRMGRAKPNPSPVCWP